MALCSLAIEDLTVDDEQSFQHVGIYRRLARRLRTDEVRFGVVEPDDALPPDATTVLNLAFWRPKGMLEVLPYRGLTADQLAHAGWHHLAARALADDAHTGEGLLLAEAIASAFDVYLVGRLIGHAPDSIFLETQVPAMRDAAHAAKMDDDRFEALLESLAAEPEKGFESLRRLLFDCTVELLACDTAEAATAVLEAAVEHPLAALLYHYELPTWVLYARAYGTSLEPNARARQLDAALRAADDPVAWLEEHWLTAAR